MKFKLILLGMLLLTGLPGNPLKAQNLIVNGTFDVNTPSFQTCNDTPWMWQASISSLYAPLSGAQWTNTGHSSWWIDITDCVWGNGRWVKQTVNTVVGQTYIIGLDLLAQAWSPAGVDIYLNGALVAHFDNWNNGTPAIPDWERFEFCWTATAASTEVKIVGNSSAGSACPIIGIDSVVMIDTDSIPYQFTLSNRCVPAVLGFQTTLPGYSIWYRNGNVVGSGNSLNAFLPGTYRVAHVSLCGDTIIKDTVVIDCDTCKPELNMRKFCAGEPTYFDFDFSRYCADPGCIGSVSIDYGDGASNLIQAPALFNFDHTYAGSGTYSVSYCWTDLCTGKTKCSTVTVVIADCRCEPELAVQKFCLGDTTAFQFTFDPGCDTCIGDMYIHYGDGGSDYNGTNFGHVYASPGTYSVKYCWFNFCESKTYCDSFTVIIEDCSCAPSVNVQNFCFGETTTFQFNFDPECDSCIGDMYIHFGDGSSAYNGTSFGHFYSAPGTYTVTYCWYNFCMDQTYCKTFTVIITECSCEPVENVEQFCFGQPTNFQFTFPSFCENCIMNLTIDYGDGNSAAGSAPYNFSHTYAATGTYNVTYCWANSCTGQSYCKTIMVTIIDCPCDPFEDVQQFCLGEPTNFQFSFGPCENCIGIVTIDYGDGSSDNKSAPFVFSHTYSAPGTYTVTYCWADLCKEQSFCRTITITIIDCLPEGEPSPTSVTETLNNAMSLFPNPAQNKVMLRGITAEKGVNKVEVVSIDGKVMLTLPVRTGTTELQIPLDKLSSGTYLIRVMGDQPTVNLKLVKE